MLAELRHFTTMLSTSLLRFARRPAPLLALFAALLGLAAAPHATAQSATTNEISPANLPGRTLTFNALSSPAPFQGTGIFTITFTATTYTMPIAQGNPTLYSGAYTAVTQSGTTLIRLAGYLVGGSPVQLVLVPSAAALIPGVFEMFADGASVAKTGTFTAGASTGGGGGGGTGNPAVTSATQVVATVGQPFVYQITTSPAATSYANIGGNAPVAISPGSGLVTGTFNTAGTFTFSFTATNASGNSPTTTVTVTAATGAPGGGTASGPGAAFAGTYTGNILQRINGVTAILGGANYRADVSAAGGVAVTLTNGASSSTLVGTIATNGAITFTGGTALSIYRITSASILVASGRPVMGSPFFVASTSSTGAATEYSLQSSTSFVAGTGGVGNVTPLATAPTNLVGYRNKVGGVYQFTVTGVARGAVWGTDVYTDDSAVAVAAVHAGVLAAGETKAVTVTILAGRPNYPASTRNGVASAAWGAWSGSYTFAGAGAVTASPTAGNVATATPTIAPGFVAGTAALAVGGRLVCPIAVSGGGTYTYQWFLNNVLIPGATSNPYIVESLTAASAGTYSVNVTNALGTARLTAGTVTIGAAGSPVIALQPISKTVSPGGTFTMATNASGTGNAFQWFRNGSALAGETGAILLRQNATASDAGNYTVRISNAAGTVTSSAGTVALSPTASRPANISVRASVAAGQNIIPGFFVAGLGTKRVIVRAVGPGLGQFDVGGTMADPKLELFRGSTKIGENDNWDGAAATTSAFTSVGAFGLTTGSRDAVLVANLAAGESYTAVVSGVGASSGVVLIEVYDADTVATSTSRLTNVSVRGNAGTGDSTLILGRVIGGDGQRTLLVRGVGPQLAAVGVSGALADPRLQIFAAAQRAVLGNDNWGQADFLGELVQASSYVGAFALEPGSRDAATLGLLDPGAYTIHLSGAGTTTGEALVEVYEVP